MTDRELMQQALEALSAMLTHMGMDEDDWNKPTFNQCRKAEDALRERLAQQEQGPVVWAGVDFDIKTTPPQRKPWVGLTDAELAEFSEAKLGAYDLCLEVEAKLKEKNT